MLCDWGFGEWGGCQPKPNISHQTLLCLPAGGQPASPGPQGVCGQPGELQEAVCPQAMEGVSGLRGGEQGTPAGLCAQSQLAVPLSSSLPQLSFSIVSLCNHLSRSLMKKVHLQPDEDLVGKCRVLLLGRVAWSSGVEGIRWVLTISHRFRSSGPPLHCAIGRGCMFRGTSGAILGGEHSKGAAWASGGS